MPVSKSVSNAIKLALKTALRLAKPRFSLFVFPAVALCGVFLITIPTSAAMEGDHTLFCEGITDTFETVGCIKKELDYHQAAVNTLYQTLSQSMDEEMRKTLADNQQKWLAYRDAECEWEEGWAKGQSLSRVYELSCLTSLTRERSDRLLRAVHAATPNSQPEFTGTPRWMNTLISQNNRVFWNFGTAQQADMNCDGATDRLVTGLALSQTALTGTQRSDTASATSAGANAGAASDESAAHGAITHAGYGLLGVAHASRTGKPAVFIMMMDSGSTTPPAIAGKAEETATPAATQTLAIPAKKPDPASLVTKGAGTANQPAILFSPSCANGFIVEAVKDVAVAASTAAPSPDAAQGSVAASCTHALRFTDTACPALFVTWDSVKNLYSLSGLAPAAAPALAPSPDSSLDPAAVITAP